MCATCGCGPADDRSDVHEPATAVLGKLEPSELRSRGLVHADPTALRREASDATIRIVRLEHDLLEHNDALARQNRAQLAAGRTLSLNLMSSPGAGKTSLLVRTLEKLAGAFPVAVVEGDQETSLDADRIRVTGTPAVQVCTGTACHLDAAMIARALRELPPLPSGIVFIENVGNLVCPAAFDLGESLRVVIVSVTEGEDKPLKYPHMFARADLLLITKADLLAHVDLDLALLLERARQIRPEVESLVVSSRTGEGMDAWLAWLVRARQVHAS